MVTNSARSGFAVRFHEALAEAGYGNAQLKELGLLFGVTGQAVRKWMNEEALPSSSRAGALAQKLGVRRAWLLDGELPMRSLQMDIADRAEGYATDKEVGLSISSEEYRLLSHYRNLPRNLQKSVTAILENINSELPAKPAKKQ